MSSIIKEDVSDDFAKHCHRYFDILQNKLQQDIIQQYNRELYDAAENGLKKWVVAADEHKVGRGRLIARK